MVILSFIAQLAVKICSAQALSKQANQILITATIQHLRYLSHKIKQDYCAQSEAERSAIFFTNRSLTLA